jgi:aryl-alcohol dehydrogenase-like predicted oxidoreductase
MPADSPGVQLNNGIEMPILGLGVYQSSPDQTVSAVKTALTKGYRLIDTAAAYFNEAEVGEGIRASGIARPDIFVTTKLWISDYGYDSTLHASTAACVSSASTTSTFISCTGRRRRTSKAPSPPGERPSGCSPKAARAPSASATSAASTWTR